MKTKPQFLLNKFFGTDNIIYSTLLTLLSVLIFSVAFASISLRYPGAWLDEHIHYARIAELTNDGAGVGQITHNQQEFLKRAVTNRDTKDEKGHTKTISSGWREDFIDLDYDEIYQESLDPAPARIYAKMVYTPYIWAMNIGKSFKMKAVDTFVLMRMMGFLFALICMLFTIKIYPYNKFAVAAIYSIPTVTLTMSAVSADTVTLSFVMLFIAMSANIYRKFSLGQNITFLEFIWYLTLSLLVVTTKMPSFVVLGVYPILIYAGWRHKIDKKLLLLLGGFLFVCAFVSIFWYLSIQNLNANETYYGMDGVDSVKQLAYVKENFQEALGTIISFALRFSYGKYQLGYAELQQNVDVPAMFSLLTLYSVIKSRQYKSNASVMAPLTKASSNLFNYYSRFLFITIALIIFTIFYLQGTPVGLVGEVRGVQARYFYSYLLLLVPIGINEVMKEIGIKDAIGLFITSSIPMLYYVILLIQQLNT